MVVVGHTCNLLTGTIFKTASFSSNPLAPGVH